MNDLLNNLDEIKKYMVSKQYSESVCNDHAYNNSNSSLSSRLNKQASSFHQPSQNFSLPPFKHDLTGSSSSTSPGLVYQITLGYILSYVSLLHTKFETELSFHQRYAKDISYLQRDTSAKSQELEIIKHMIQFDCFTIVNKKDNLNFLKVENILDRLTLLVRVLEETIAFINKGNKSRILVFFNESECQKCFTKIFPEFLMQKEYFNKICSELWKFIRHFQHEEPSEYQHSSRL